MKKITGLFIIFAVLLCGCRSSDAERNEKLSPELYEASLEAFEYPIDDPFVFSADESGGIVCADRAGKSVKRYSQNGMLIGEFPIAADFTIISLACDENRIFILGTNSDERLILGEVKNGEITELYSEKSDTKNSRISLEISGDKLYFSAVGGNPETFDYPDGAYRYNGLMAYSYDLKSNTREEICGIVSFAKHPKGGVMLYCCDSGGFYFTRYDDRLGEKYYSKLGDLYAFCLIGDYSVAYPSVECIKASLLDGEVSIDIFEADSYGGRPLLFSSGTLILNHMDALSGKITVKRIRPQDCINNLDPVTVIMTGNFVESLAKGFAVKKMFFSEEEIALKLLSGDSDWDAAVIYSRQPFAAKTASRGYFMPFDGQAEKEYLEACHQHIRSVCYNDDGEIWALPLEDNISCILYNPEKCGEYGIDFSKMTTEEFIEISRRLCEDDTMRGKWVDIRWNYLTETLLNDCVYNLDADSEQFRSVIAALKKNANILSDAEYMRPVTEETLPDGSIIAELNNLMLGKTNEFLYQTDIGEYTDMALSLKRHPDFSAAKIPFEGTNTGYCKLLVVNPYAPKLKEALELVSAIAREKSEILNEYADFTSEGKSKLDEIFNDSRIIMGIPDEIYWNDFISYLGDEITLDEFISKVKKKTETYLYE